MHTMAASSRHATTIPRFLLPQFSWTAKASRPVALRALEARRHRCCAPFKEGAVVSRSLLQARTIRQWRKRSPQYAAGYASALESRRNFSASAPQSRDHHFDTLKFVQRLKDEGFTEEQAEGMMKVLGDVIEERSAFHSSI